MHQNQITTAPSFSGQMLDDVDKEEDADGDNDDGGGVKVLPEYPENPNETHRVHEPVEKLFLANAAPLGSDAQRTPPLGELSCC